MITEERVIEIAIRANPAQKKIEPDQLPAVYLATLQNRSSEMQTIETQETTTPEPRGGSAKWLAIAVILIAVVATVGILLFTGDDEAPVATVPEVEEVEPVPSTEPEAVVEPEETTPSTVTDPTSPPLFDFQTGPGDYLVEHRAQSFVFTSDGEWAVCSFRCADWTDGLSMTSRKVSGGIVAIDPSSSGPDVIKAELEAIPGLIVGDWTPFEPQHTEATWTGQALAVDIDDGAGTDPSCAATGSGATYPCAFFDLAGIGGFVVHGPITIYLIDADGGSTMLATPYWGHEPLPSDEEFAALEEHFLELVQTIRFVD